MTSDAFKNPEAYALTCSSAAILKKTTDLIAAFQATETTKSSEGLIWTLSTGTIHSLKIDGVKQSKKGLVYSLDIAKECTDIGYGLNYTVYPRAIKDNLMATVYKKWHTKYLTPVLGLGIGTAKQGNDGHNLSWNVNLGTETELGKNVTFDSATNYTHFGNKSYSFTSMYGLRFKFKLN
jgi:hypothetical protein